MSVSKEELKQIREKVSKELEPFLDGIRTKRADCKLFKQAYIHSQERLKRVVDIVVALIKRGAGKPTYEFYMDVIELFAYLGFVESLGNNLVNLLVMLLVANGRDFHIECRHRTPRIKHAVSIKDLEDEGVPLTTKLHFLKDNGLVKLSSTIDSNLRNKIAHLRIDVRRSRRPEGPDIALGCLHGDRIYIGGKPASEVASSSSNKLLYAISIASSLIEQVMKAKGFAEKEKPTP